MDNEWSVTIEFSNQFPSGNSTRPGMNSLASSSSAHKKRKGKGTSSHLKEILQSKDGFILYCRHMNAEFAIGL